MSGDGKRGGAQASVLAPILDSTPLPASGPAGSLQGGLTLSCPDSFAPGRNIAKHLPTCSVENRVRLDARRWLSHTNHHSHVATLACEVPSTIRRGVLDGTVRAEASAEQRRAQTHIR